MAIHEIEELAELNQIRLDEGLTYETLAEQISAAAGSDIDASVICRAVKNTGRRPNDRTLHKISRFLEKRRSNKKRSRSSR